MVLIFPDPPLLEFIKCGSHSFWVSLLLICLTNEFRYTTLSLNCKVIIQVKPNLRYTRMVVVPAMHAVYAKAEKVPFFYAIFKALFGMVTRKSDAWVRDLAAQKGQFTPDIHQCLRCAGSLPVLLCVRQLHLRQSEEGGLCSDADSGDRREQIRFSVLQKVRDFHDVETTV